MSRADTIGSDDLPSLSSSRDTSDSCDKEVAKANSDLKSKRDCIAISNQVSHTSASLPSFNFSTEASETTSTKQVLKSDLRRNDSK